MDLLCTVAYVFRKNSIHELIDSYHNVESLQIFTNL